MENIVYPQLNGEIGLPDVLEVLGSLGLTPFTTAWWEGITFYGLGTQDYEYINKSQDKV